MFKLVITLSHLMSFMRNSNIWSFSSTKNKGICSFPSHCQPNKVALAKQQQLASKYSWQHWLASITQFRYPASNDYKFWQTPCGNRPPLRPYLGYYQICVIQGHTANRYLSFQLVPIQPSNTWSTPLPSTPIAPWQPQAHFVANVVSNNPAWLLDSSVSHHVTADLSNLSLHAPYTSSDDVMTGDGTGLSITHAGSTSLFTANFSFKLNNLLCVPNIKKNLILISQFRTTNNVSLSSYQLFFRWRIFIQGQFLCKETLRMVCMSSRLSSHPP